MLFSFLSLQWKTLTRSPIWHKNLALNLVIGFFLFLFGAYLLILGILIHKVLKDIVPDIDPFELFNSFIIFYFLFDLLIRFMMQSLPRLMIESYLHLPIRKFKVISYMLGRTVADVFNFIPLLVFVPVTFTIVTPAVGSSRALVWLLSLCLLILANNFFATYLKRQLGAKPALVLATAGVITVAIVLNKFHILSLTGLSASFFKAITSHLAFILVPVAWTIAMLTLHYRFLLRHLYPDEVQVKKQFRIEQDHDNAASRYLKTMGLMGSFISLEIKLYWRNKRTRTMLYMFPIFILYGFFFYPQPSYMAQTGFLMFVGVFMTGGMMINYANYAFGYESNHFDFLLTKKIDFEQYIRMKYYISVMICFVCFILTIPYLFYGFKILLINAAMFLYNIGILAYLLLYLATYNKNRIDLKRGGAFNYQGIGAMNWLAVLPAFLLPIIVYIPFKLAGHPNWGIAFTGLVGVAGLFFSRPMIRAVVKGFCKRKYVMASNFREK